MIKIAIVDDHQLFSEGLSSLLSTMEFVSISGLYENGSLFLEQLPDQAPDLVLMDIDMPVMNGIVTAENALKILPELKIIMLSMHNDYPAVTTSLRTGIHGFLIKNTSKEELRSAIETVMSGEQYFSKEVTDLLVRKIQSPNIHQPVNLTPREQEILACICDGSSTQEIANQLFISANTVETHRKNLLVKTGCKNSVGLVRFALDNELIQPKK